MIFRYSQQTSQLVGFTIASECSELWYHISGTIHYSTGVYQGEGKNKIFFPSSIQPTPNYSSVILGARGWSIL